MINNELKEYTRDESLILKGIAILFMLGLHLYNRDVTTGFYEPWIYIGNQPFIYYISFMFDACVPMYCFVAGYAAYIKKDVSLKKQSSRIFELLINYWIIVLITIMLGIVLHHNKIPGSFSIVLGNLFLYKITYVGAWWFMQTYMLLFLTSKCIIKIIDYMHPVVMSIVIFIIYIVSYYFRMMNPVLTDDQFINEIVNIIILYGTSLFSYCVGIMFKKYFIISILRDGLKKYSNIFGVVIIISCFIVHIIIKSMIVAPFTALLFICGFSLLTLNSKLKKVLCFMGKHSTNIWLIHMQFYMVFFKDVIFQTNTVIGCFIIVLILCICCSFFIKYLVKRIVKVICLKNNQNL